MKRLYSVGSGKYGWFAEMNWRMGMICDQGAMTGTIRTCYGEPSVTEAVGRVLELAEQFGVEPVDTGQGKRFGLFLRSNKGMPPENSDALLCEAA